MHSAARVVIELIEYDWRLLRSFQALKLALQEAEGDDDGVIVTDEFFEQAA